MAKSIKRANKKRSQNRQKKTRNQKNCGSYKKTQSIKKNRASKPRHKSKSRSRSNKRSCQMGGSPAYRMHEESGLLSKPNENTKVVPITYYEDADINQFLIFTKFQFNFFYFIYYIMSIFLKQRNIFLLIVFLIIVAVIIFCINKNTKKNESFEVNNKNKAQLKKIGSLLSKKIKESVFFLKHVKK